MLTHLRGEVVSAILKTFDPQGMCMPFKFKIYTAIRLK